MHSTENSTGNDLLPQRCGHIRPHSPIKSSHFDNKKFTRLKKKRENRHY